MKSPFIDWLRKATEAESCANDNKEAYCKICKVVLRAHHADLINHSNTVKHKQKANSFKEQIQPKLNSYGITFTNNYLFIWILINK